MFCWSRVFDAIYTKAIVTHAMYAKSIHSRKRFMWKFPRVRSRHCGLRGLQQHRAHSKKMHSVNNVSPMKAVKLKPSKFAVWLPYPRWL